MNRLVITQDNDFSALLAGAAKPTVLRFQPYDGRPAAQVRLLLANLQRLSTDIAAGAIAVFEDSGVRVRPLPIVRP